MSTYQTLDDLRYVTYSHSDYLDVLQIHTDHHVKKKKKTSLLINKCDLPPTISSHYENVIYYDEALPYASRIYTAISSIEEDFFLLMHDNDILISEKPNLMHMLATIFRHRKMDRLDLQHTPLQNVNGLINVNYEYQLTKQHYFFNTKMGTNYVYNVNPSIWKKECLLEVTKKFHNLNYREMEQEAVQKFCSNKEFYKVHCPNPQQVQHAGHFLCSEMFVFFHITHGGKFVPKDGTTVYGQSYRDVASRYKGIINRYNLTENKRGFG